MRLLVFIVLFLFPLAPSFAQQRGTLAWKAGEPLQWSHFKGKPDATDKVHGAVTFAGFDIKVEKISFPGGTIRFKARAVFDQQRSWVKAGEPDSHLLAHEQLHFDITELYARKLTKKLNALQLKSKDKAQIKKWQNYYFQAQMETQKQYDRESVHGLHFEMQEVWRELIDAELKASGPGLNLREESYTSKE